MLECLIFMNMNIDQNNCLLEISSINENVGMLRRGKSRAINNFKF